jgi:high-affinity iron transporter
MYGVSIFVLREVFEIVLIITVMLAATRELQNRSPYIWGGIAAGALGAGIIAAFTSKISQWAGGMGQEILNATILLTAAAMIGWTAVWMRVHGRELAGSLKEAASNRSMWILFFIIALAVFREGAEMVLFSFAANAQGTSWLDIAKGAIIGIIGGTIIGGLFYTGMIRLFARHFLSITSTLLAFLAAGLAAKGVYYLAMIGMLPELGYQIWDSSSFIRNESILGESLGVLVGYNATPSGIELLTYALMLALIYVGLKFSQNSLERAKAA